MMHDDAESETENPYASPEDGPIDAELVQPLPSTVSVPLAIAMVVVLGCGFLIHVGFGIGLSLLALPSYARAVKRSSMSAASGNVPTTADRLLSFFGSLLVVTLCGIAGGIAFVGTCLGSLIAVLGIQGGDLGRGDDTWLILVIALSALGFLLAAGLIYWACWPKKRR